MTDNDIINRQKAEIERLKDLCADCSMLKGKIGTISDLQKQIEYWQRGYNDLRQKLKTAKAEAFKEFAERLKEKGFTDNHYEHESIVYVADIDNLLSWTLHQLDDESFYQISIQPTNVDNM